MMRRLERILFRLQLPEPCARAASDAVSSLLRAAVEAEGGRFPVGRDLGPRDIELFIALRACPVRVRVRLEKSRAHRWYRGAIILLPAGGPRARAKCPGADRDMARAVRLHLARDPRFSEVLELDFDPRPRASSGGFAWLPAVLALVVVLAAQTRPSRQAYGILPRVSASSPLLHRVPPFPIIVLDARELSALDRRRPEPTAIQLDMPDGRSFRLRWQGARSYELRESTLTPTDGGPLFAGFRSGDSATISIGYDAPIESSQQTARFQSVWSRRLWVLASPQKR
jgi:hypothetical protein